MVVTCVRVLALALAIVSPGIVFSKDLPRDGAETLQRSCEQAAASIDARVGIAVFLDGAEHPAGVMGAGELYPMMSVVKLPLAVVVLQGVADQRWSLEQRFALTAEDLKPDTWSPLRELHPSGGCFTLRELLMYMVTQSDNNVCDFLFSLVGGPAVVESGMRRWLGGERMFIRYDEMGLRDVSKVSANSASPLAFCRLLRALDSAASGVQGGGAGEAILPPAEAQELLDIMAQTRTGSSCLAAGVPVGCRLEHKTGSGPKLPDGRISARNDVGILRMPNGRYAYVAVFVADAAASSDAMDAVMRRVAEATSAALLPAGPATPER